MSGKKTCVAKVLVKDTYRRGRRPGPKFRMHYALRKCRRAPTAGGEYCWYHERVQTS